MQIYTVLIPVRHDGVFYAVGSQIKLETAHADQLLAVKAIELAPEPAPRGKKGE